MAIKAFIKVRIRINANGKHIDVWLIYHCSQCEHTYNLPIYSHISIGALNKSEYRALMESNLDAVFRFGLDKRLFQKSGAVIYDEPIYELKVEESREEGTIQYLNPSKIKVRYDKLLAECLNISRVRVKQLLENGSIKKVKYSDSGVVFLF